MNPAFLGYVLVRGTVYKQINVGSCIHTRDEHRTKGVRCEQEGFSTKFRLDKRDLFEKVMVYILNRETVIPEYS